MSRRQAFVPSVLDGADRRGTIYRAPTPARSCIRQRRFLKIGGDADDGVDQRGGRSDFERRAHTCLQVEMLWVNADGRKTGEHAAGGAADGRGEYALEPDFDSLHGEDRDVVAVLFRGRVISRQCAVRSEKSRGLKTAATTP